MTKDEALKMAIEALKDADKGYAVIGEYDELIQACKEALEQPVQEPVGLIEDSDFKNHSKQQLFEYIVYLREELSTHPAPSCNGEWSEKIIKQWDDIRKLIADGDKSSYPRDWFESLAPSWQGLSLPDIEALYKQSDSISLYAFTQDVRAIEQALRNKNGS